MMIRIMSTFVLTLLGLTAGSSYPCAVRREIAPCTCRLQEPKLTTISISCEQMPSFSNVVEILHNRFPPEQDIVLKLTFSKFDDMDGKSFKELGMSLSSLNLNHDDLSHLNEQTFTGLEGLDFFSLADNRLLEIPQKTLRKMPNLKTLDLGRSRISAVINEDFEGVPNLKHLMLASNSIYKIESHALPRNMRTLHLGRNNIRFLNNSLRSLNDLLWLFLNGNQLTSLHGQLPIEAPKLMMINVANNQLQTLPQEMRNYLALDTLFLENNDLQWLNGTFQKLKKLKRIHLTHNSLQTLADDEFAENVMMDDIQLGFNRLHTLNGAFRPMKRLRTINLTNNHLEEFSLQEVRGLHHLKVVDLSHNRIMRLTGRMENLVELETRIEELHLEHNQLAALEGALFGINGLQWLNLSNNKLQSIAPDDLIGLDDLRFLDISFNKLKTLEETSKSFLPRLQELIANDNYLTSLDKDFHGLPVLCTAVLSHNQIEIIGRELGTRSKCGGMGGMLMVSLHDNPVLCHPDFNITAAYLLSNMTIMQGDFSICPSPTIATTSTTTSTTTTTTTMVPPVQQMIIPNSENLQIDNSYVTLVPPVDIVSLIRGQPPPPIPQVIPLLYSPDIHESSRDNFIEQATNDSTTPASSDSAPIAEPEISVPPTSTSTVTEDAMPITETSEVLTPPIVVLKDEGQNLTLVIPMKNGVIKSDSGAEQYTQKEDTSREITQVKRPPSAITNIEIVDINPLPKETPSHVIPGLEDRQPLSNI